MSKLKYFITILFILLSLFWSINRKIHTNSFELKTTLIFLLFSVIPFFVNYFINKMNRFNIAQKKFQWIPNILFIIIIIQTFLVLFSEYNLTYEVYEFNKQNDEIEMSIKNWILDNSLYPKTYFPIDFKSSLPIGQGFRIDDDLKILISEFKDSTPTNMNYYFIRHKYILKNKYNKVDTLISYFQLSSSYEVTNIRTKEETEAILFSNTNYEWRNIYGNNKQNLELEIKGNSDIKYLYKHFDKQGWLESNTIFQNGKAEGFFYSQNPNKDTTIIANFKNGVVTHFEEKKKPLKNSIPEMYETEKYFRYLFKRGESDEEHKNNQSSHN